ncbi:hypothetical protein C3495_05105 [Clostridiaceae bacterium 14S0207]|nr:hypothetical protein C3495_05105 [Clostridiaceae bacterium 14S0207]
MQLKKCVWWLNMKNKSKTINLSKTLDKGKYIIENKDKLLKRRRRRRKQKRIILITILLSTILITMAVKLPYFNITSVKVQGNKNASIDEIKKEANSVLNQNIFLFSGKEIKQKLIGNKYIHDVKVNKKLPNKVIINIEEREASFYVKQEKEYLITDVKGNVLEKRNNIKGMSLVELEGFKEIDIKDNTLMFKSDRQEKVLQAILDLLNKNMSNIKITAINLNDVYNIVVKSKNIQIILGNEYNLREKLNKGINIINLHKIKDKKGYIDISYEGNPIVFTE